MHGAYPISNDDMRYVLSTFVVTPVRWLFRYGWRPMSNVEKSASVQYYREVARHMNIRDAPSSYGEFESLMDSYEQKHFAFSTGGRAVADATLGLLGTFPPFHPALGVDAGLIHQMAAVTGEGRLLTWGRNGAGQTGTGGTGPAGTGTAGMGSVGASAS